MARAEVHVHIADLEPVKERFAALVARVELMAPVVEAARAWYANGVDPDQRYWTALCRAIEDYEEQVERWTGVA